MSVQVHIEVTEDGKRIQAKSPWYEGAPEDAKSIPGHRWDKGNRRWTYPLTLESCTTLRSVYGPRLVIGPKLTRWARAAIARENEMRALGTAQDADLQKVTAETFPKMAEAMGNRTYQRSGARYIAVGRRVGIFDEVGLGKTITVLAGIIEAGKFNGRHLVVSNKTSLRSVWEDQINLWTEGRGTPFVADGTLAQRKKVLQEFESSTAPSKWLIVNPHMLQIKLDEYCAKCKKFVADMDAYGDDLEHTTMAHETKHEVRLQKYPELQQRPWDSIVVDEAHKVLTTGNKSTKATSKTQVALGVDSLPVTEDGLKIAMTGTPARGKELQMWGIMNWLWPASYSSRWSWIETYFHANKGFFGMEIGGLRQERVEDFWRMIDRHAIRRTRREVRADLPESESYIEWVPLTKKHAKQYNQFVDEGVAELDSGLLVGDGILSELTRLKQMAYGVWDVPASGNKLIPTEDSPKLERLLDRLERFGVTGDPKTEERQDPRHYKFVVATQFTEVADAVVTALSKRGIDSLLITGAVTGKRRAEAVRSFQDDPDGPRVMVMNTYAGGESITLDRYCDTMFILDETFVADDQTQLYGRIDNRSVSAEEAVPRRFIHLLTRGTIDEQIAASNLSQMEMEHRLLDSRRGLDLAKMFHRKEL